MDKNQFEIRSFVDKTPILAQERIERKHSWIAVLVFALGMFIVALNVDQELGLWEGLVKIWTANVPLTTDFSNLAGLGSATINAISVFLLNLFVVYITGNKLRDDMYAVAFIQMGFAFFGITFWNSLPIIIGTFIYGFMWKIPAKSVAFKALMGSALGPFVNYVAFAEVHNLPFRYGLAIIIGLVIGFISYPIATSCTGFHMGYTLYNSGFADGLIALVIVALGRFMGLEMESKPGNNLSNSDPIAYYLLGFSLVMLVISLFLNRRKLKNYIALLKHPGKGGLYAQQFGFHTAWMNMSIMGIVAFLYVFISQAPFNGPVVGSMITVIGFAAMGKHPLNSIPVLLGVSLANLLGPGSASTASTMTAGLLGASLAPISGEFGPVAGIVAGFLHASVLSNVLGSQAGMNLYNNGFSSGLVAAFLAPILEALRARKNPGSGSGDSCNKSVFD